MRKLLHQIQDASKQAHYSIAEFREHLVARHDLIEQLSLLMGKINAIEIVTPTNLEAEKNKWLQAAHHQKWTIPKFQYNQKYLSSVVRLRNPICRYLKALPTTGTDQLDELIINILRKRAKSGLHFVDLAKSILDRNDEMSTIMAELEYGLPTRQCYRKALHDAKTYRNRSNINLRNAKHRYDAEAIRRMFVFVCEKYHLKAKMVIDENVSNIDVRGQGDEVKNDMPVVVIPAHYTVSERRMMELVVHELFGHLHTVQDGNSLFAGLGSGELRSSDDSIYEGFAMHLEAVLARQYFGEKHRDIWPFYTIAIYEAAHQEMDIAEISQQLYDAIYAIDQDENMTLDDVWITLYRTVFRGRTRAGFYVFPKDYVYYSGSLMLEKIFDSKYEFLLQIGEFSPDELLQIVKLVHLEPNDLPYAIPKNFKDILKRQPVVAK